MMTTEKKDIYRRLVEALEQLKLASIFKSGAQMIFYFFFLVVMLHCFWQLFHDLVQDRVQHIWAMK